MLPANVEKVKGMLQKSFQALPMATDLPRLANIKIVHNGSEIPAPDATATTLDKLEWIFSSLTKILEGPEAAQTVSEKFKAAFTEDVSASGTISKNQVTTFLTSIGGDDSTVIKALKPVNQVTISPAIIELKTLLGLDNMTKDVRNSWYFVIDITDSTISVSSHKRDQCIKNLFQMEWVLSFTLTRPSLDCADVTLRVDDLVFNADCHTKRPEKKEEVKRILKRYSTDEVLAVADTKIWCVDLSHNNFFPPQFLRKWTFMFSKVLFNAPIPPNISLHPREKEQMFFPPLRLKFGQEFIVFLYLMLPMVHLMTNKFSSPQGCWSHRADSNWRRSCRIIGCSVTTARTTTSVSTFTHRSETCRSVRL
jgi:hypothetical protein